jgi:hypothetical protein
MALAISISLELIRIVLSSIFALGKPFTTPADGPADPGDDERAATETRRKSFSLKVISFGAVRAASPDDFAIDCIRSLLKPRAPAPEKKCRLNVEIFSALPHYRTTARKRTIDVFESSRM